MVSSYWVTFEDGSAGCVQARSNEDVDAVATEATGKEVHDVKVLPYPAEPRLRVVEHDRYGRSPSFCYRPGECAGRTSCPTNPSCTS